MAKVALLTVHGMGLTSSDYAEELRQALQGKLGGRFDDVAFETIHYQGILHPDQHALWRRTGAAARMRRAEPRKLMLFGMAGAAGLENGREHDGSVYELAQIEIARTMLAARDRLGHDEPVVFIAHSLGCQVLSSYFYDAQKALRGTASAGIWRDIDRHGPAIAGHALIEDEKAFLRGSTFRRWITTGCNMPISMAAHRGLHVLPIERPTADFRWVNLYDPDDMLGWPLQPLSPGYRALVEDRNVAVAHSAESELESWTPRFHNAYWCNAVVLDLLADMLLEFL